MATIQVHGCHGYVSAAPQAVVLANPNDELSIEAGHPDLVADVVVRSDSGVRGDGKAVEAAPIANDGTAGVPTLMGKGDARQVTSLYRFRSVATNAMLSVTFGPADVVARIASWPGGRVPGP